MPTTETVRPINSLPSGSGPTVPATMQAIPPGTSNPAPLTIPVPSLDPDRVLLEVHASSINPADYHGMTNGLVTRVLGILFNGGKKPVPPPALGTDVAGVVVAIGEQFSGFDIGDEVFGAARGSLAQYAAAKFIVRKPTSLSFDQAASMNVAGITALQAVRDKGKVTAGQSVLINGASGGVGTFAIQIARALGAEVTAVCSERNAELVRSLGASLVIDYKQEDFTSASNRYDVILDIVGNYTIRRLLHPLKPSGTLVLAGGGHQDGYKNVHFVRPVLRMMVGAPLMNRMVSQRIVSFIANTNRDDLNELARLVENGQLRPSITRTFTLEQVGQAFENLETGHTTGKFAISVKN